MTSDSDTPVQRNPAAVWIALWLTLLVYGFVAAPIPGVNEPHYLGKAKHFWNPAWCPGDLLLASSNAHLVFYVTFGFWKALPLPLLALLGRLVGYGLMARGWQRMHAVLGLESWTAWRSLLVFLALASWGNFSGEWLVGGIEGKVISYACLMFAFADWQSSRLLRAALWAGAAISFHPVVGMWAVLAAGLAAATLRLFSRLAPAAGERVRERGRALEEDAMTDAGVPASSGIEDRLKPGLQQRQARDSSPPSPWPSPPGGGEGTKPKGILRQRFIAFVLLFAAAAPGMIPALALIFTDDPAHVRINGTFLQVYYRLAHHLDPMEFPIRSYACYVGLCLVIVALQAMLSRVAAGRTWLLVVFWSAMFALAGFIAGYGPRPAAEMPFYLERMKLLKFYPFRLFDVLVPLTVSMQVSAMLARTSFRSVHVIAAAGLLAMLASGLWRQREMRQPTVFDRPEWIDVCHWVRDHTPTDGLIQSPDRNPNFKWHAQRPEYVNYKDVPQDNAGLVEWNRRLRFLRQWYQDHNPDGYSADELRAFRTETGIDYIVTDRLGPFDVPACYTNDRFRVYDLTELVE